jgi:hypothetical protein
MATTNKSTHRSLVTLSMPKSVPGLIVRAPRLDRTSEALRALLVDAASQETAVDDEHFAVDEAGSVGRQEHGGADELLHPSEPFHRRAHEELAASRRLVEQRLVQCRSKYAGRNRVDAHAFGPPLDGERFRERSGRRFAGRVGGDFEEGNERRERRDIDDSTVMAFEHRAPEDLAATQRARQVGVEDVVPLLLGDIEGRFAMRLARTVD